MPENWFRDKKINMVLRMSEAKTPEIPDDVPWIGEFVTSQEDLQALRLLIAANELGRPFVASRQVPAAQIEMLRDGVRRHHARQELSRARRQARR